MKITIREDGTKRVQKMFVKPSRTKQEFRDQQDVNNIVKRFKKIHGVELMTYLKTASGGQYGDFSGVVDYQTALEQVNRANAAFEALPAILRKRFDNDPAQFLDFCMNPSNLDEMRKLGLAKPEVTQPVKGADAPKPAAG